MTGLDSEGPEDSSEVDEEVVEELARQGRRWRADKEARASEGECRAKELADAAATRTELAKAELARKKSARKSPERVRVNQAPLVDVREDRIE